MPIILTYFLRARINCLLHARLHPLFMVMRYDLRQSSPFYLPGKRGVVVLVFCLCLSLACLAIPFTFSFFEFLFLINISGLGLLSNACLFWCAPPLLLLVNNFVFEEALHTGAEIPFLLFFWVQPSFVGELPYPTDLSSFFAHFWPFCIIHEHCSWSTM